MADFIEDAQAAETYQKALATVCFRMAWQAHPADVLCRALLQLPQHTQQAVFKHMLLTTPLYALLAKLPFMLHQQLAVALLRRASADAAEGQCRGHLLDLAAPSPSVSGLGGINGQLSAEACTKLSAQLPLLPALSVWTCTGKVCDMKMSPLLHALRTQTQLTLLDLGDTRPGPLIATALASALPSWRLLQNLRLPCESTSVHCDADNDLLLAIATYLHQKTLTRFEIDKCSRDAAAAMLTALPALKHLSMCEGVPERVLSQLTSLTYLHLGFQRMHHDITQELAACLCSSASAEGN